MPDFDGLDTGALNWRSVNDVFGRVKNGPQEYLRTLQSFLLGLPIACSELSTPELGGGVDARSVMPWQVESGPIFRRGSRNIIILLFRPRKT